MIDIGKIRTILDEASRWDMDYEAFGTQVHLHLLRPVLPLEELEAWEEQAELTLPKEYRIYLTQLGNGGAGPAYGLPPFNPPSAQLLRRPCIYSVHMAADYQKMIRRFHRWDNIEEWTLYLEYFPDSPGRKDPNWQELHNKEWNDQLEECLDRDLWEPMLYNGQLLIANAGCTVDQYLILNGSHRGFVHCCSTDSAYYLPPTFDQYCKESLTKDFAAYYMDYVDKTQDFCQNMTAEKRRRAAWERAQARDFLAAAKASDWQGARRLVETMGDSRNLSRKSRSLYHQYEAPMMKAFPEDKLVRNFFDGAFGSWNSYGYPNEPISFQEDGGRWLNPRQPFEAFVQTFYD